jgi:AAA+ superfamily predicted ATPase
LKPKKQNYANLRQRPPSTLKSEASQNTENSNPLESINLKRDLEFPAFPNEDSKNNLDPKLSEKEDRSSEQASISLRPESLEEFRGQNDLKKRLLITLSACQSRGECLPHQLFAGPPGLGKTTLATILAKEMGAEIKVTSGPSLEKPGDLAGTLVSLEANDILFIDEIHTMVGAGAALRALIQRWQSPRGESNK